MHVSSHGLVAQGISSVRHAIRSPLAIASASRTAERAPPHREDREYPLQGFAVSVPVAPCLVIEDAVGCSVRVTAGKAWITAEGAPRDVIADVGTTVPLQSGVRFNVSGFHDTATVLITAPRRLRDVGFSLKSRNGMHVLAVKGRRSRLPALLSAFSAAVATLAGLSRIDTGSSRLKAST